jgi:hypothetical protein
VAPRRAKYSPVREAQDPNASAERLQELSATGSRARCAVARNLSAPTALLERLAEKSGRALLEALAQNPNTPPAALLKAGRLHPEALVTNPVFSLLLLEDPNLLSSLPADLWCRLLRRSEPPEWLWPFAARHPSPWVRRVAAQAPRAPKEVLALLAEDGVIEVRVQVATNPGVPQEVLRALTSNPLDRVVRAQAARHPALPPALLEELARDRAPGVRSGTAQNPRAPVALLEALAGDKTGMVRAGVASNPGAPLELLTVLARDPHPRVRQLAAANPALPAELLPALAQAREIAVRAAVAARPACPEALLLSLARDRADAVRRVVAENPGTPLEALLSLSRNKSTHWWLLRNPSLPLSLLRELCSSDNAHLRTAALRKLRHRERQAQR